MGYDRSEGISWDADLDRLTVAEAAEALGISQDAVRKRIARRTIAHDRAPSGRVYVYLPTSETVHKTDQDTDQDDATKTTRPRPSKTPTCAASRTR
jgi:excisionase family DNA binding protein